MVYRHITGHATVGFLAILAFSQLTLICSTNSLDTIDVVAEMAANTGLGSALKKQIFGSERNIWCKPPNDPYAPSVCHYDPELPYAIFKGKSIPGSGIESVSFNSTEALKNWAAQRGANTSLVAYKPGCPPCATLLAALETVAQSNLESGRKIYKMNVKEGQHLRYLDDLNVELNGTPTLWNITDKPNLMTAVPVDDISSEFIFLQKPEYISLDILNKRASSLSKFSSFVHNYRYEIALGLVATTFAAVATYWLYGKYKAYKQKSSMQKLNPTTEQVDQVALTESEQNQPKTQSNRQKPTTEAKKQSPKNN